MAVGRLPGEGADLGGTALCVHATRHRYLVRRSTRERFRPCRCSIGFIGDSRVGRSGFEAGFDRHSLKARWIVSTESRKSRI